MPTVMTVWFTIWSDYFAVFERAFLVLGVRAVA
jgi:hypothetical protein